MARPPQQVPFTALDAEIVKLFELLRTHGVEVPAGSSLDGDASEAFRFLYYATFAEERPAQMDGHALARAHVGLGDLSTKLNVAATKPGFDRLLPHLTKMVEGSVRMNAASSVLDDAANKTSELYVACLALNAGLPVQMDHPTKSSGGANPDVITTFCGREWALAIKTAHSSSSQTIFDNIMGAARQIERSGKHGVVFVNLKNRLDHGALMPSGHAYISPEHAMRALGGWIDDVVRTLVSEIVEADWIEAFKGDLARPVVAFMAQSVMTALVGPDDGRFVPIRALRVLVAPPARDRDPPHPLDEEAVELLTALNHELQRNPPSSVVSDPQPNRRS